MNENELIEEHLGLVIKIAKSFSPKDQTEMDDFIQEGSIALLKALRKHDIKQGKISTLAWKYITKALIGYRKKTRENKDKQGNLENMPAKDSGEKLWESIPDTLSETELTVVNMRYEGYTFAEIGKKINHTKAWASHIFKNAIDKIRQANEQ